MFKLRFQSLAFVLSLVILAGFFGYLRAWTGPTSSPPGSNAPSPVNIGTSDQGKAGRLSATEFYDADNSSFYINPSGDSMVSGTLSLGGDLYDVTNSKKIYDGVAGKFDPSVMPYEKGDLTSDWATNTSTDSYYVVQNAADITCGTVFGRGETGTNRGNCDICYDCVGTSCGAVSVDGSAATALGCTTSTEACRRCNAGTCTYYSDMQQHGCTADFACLGAEGCAIGPAYCASHSGVAVAYGGVNVFCADNKMWSVTDSAGHTWNPAGSGVCTDACNYCANLTYAGFSDWRLPDKTTLTNVYGDITCSNCTSWDPHCCSSSADGPLGYWSSTGDGSTYAWGVGFTSGYVYSATKGDSFSVRCLRP